MNAPVRVEQNAVRSIDAPQYAVTQHRHNANSLLLDPNAFQTMQALAKIMASGKIAVPLHLRGKEADCFAIVMVAMRWGMDPFAVAAKTYFVNDALGYEGQLVTAVVNNSPLLATRLNWEWFGPWDKIMGKFKQVESKTKKDPDTGLPKTYIVPNWNLNDEAGLGVRCSARLVDEKEPRVLELLMVQARVRNSPLWAEDPRQQLGYLSSRRWARLHASDAIMGIYTPDELVRGGEVDMGMVDVVEPPIEPELEKAMKDAAAKGTKAYADWWRKLDEPVRNTLVFHPEHERCKVAATEVDKTAFKPKTTTAPTPAPTPGPTPAPTPDPKTGEVDPPAAATSQDGDHGEFVPTYATVMAKLLEAEKQGSSVGVEVASEWIDAVPEDQQQALRDEATRILAKMEAK